MDRELKERIAANEAAFREVNEGIARGQYPGEDDEPRGFRCECARLGCNVMVELTRREYEAIRARSRYFLVSPGHELPEVEHVVDRGDAYVVVEKADLAGRLADESDPRPDDASRPRRNDEPDPGA
jgi:hypothetical protein